MAFENPFKNLSKPEQYAVIGGGALVTGYVLYRHKQSSGSWNPFSKGTANATTATGGINPITGMAYSDDNATDPITGKTYLDEATQYGSVAAAEASVSAYGASTATGSGIPVNPASPFSQGTLNTPVGTNVYTSNAAWAQAATAGLVSVGYDGPTVASALGKYLTEKPATPDEITIINTAIAEYGPAPVGNLQVIPAPASGPGAGIPVAAPSVSAGHVISATTSSITFGFNQSNAAKATCTLVGPGIPTAGNTKTVATPNTAVSVTFTGLQKGHSYTLFVIPINSSGTGGIQGHIDGGTTAH
jgi:hypothetical protein